MVRGEGHPAGTARGNLRARVLLALAAAWPVPAVAQSATAPTIPRPPVLSAREPAVRLQTMIGVAREAPSPAAPLRDVVYDLTVAYRDAQLWNPTENRFDKVHLRSYQGTGVDPSTPFVGPQIEFYPGQTVRMTLHNKLPDDSTCQPKGGSANIPHCFNGTNMHTHGLWTNPAGNGDNVLISIDPNVDFQYEYNVAPDHPAGTFWYHSHRHGSTALQVSSGMAGALIVRGTRPPTPSANGDLDTLLKPTADQTFAERVMVFQQIQYACRDTDGKIEINPDKTYKCEPGQVGEMVGYEDFGPGTWPKSGRFTSINGAVLGRLDDVEAGKIERWRMIHGGVRDTIALQLRERAPGAKEPVGLRAAEAQKYVDVNCTGAPLPVQLVAADGLTMAAARTAQVAVFQPGYRWDALVVFPKAGDYCILNEPSVGGASVNQNFRPTQLLGTIRVKAGTPVGGDLPAYVQSKLVAAAQSNMPPDVREKVKTQLADGMKLTSFVPHRDVDESEVTGTQTATFDIDVSQPNTTFFEIDGKPYDPTRMDRMLVLGGVDEWTLESKLASHPFHIHVNPFQIVKIIAPDGKTDVSAPGAVDDFQKDKDGKPIVDWEYPGLKGVWKDTIFVKNIGKTETSSGVYKIVFRTRYERYIGDFVLHCHILDHEDQGMMQNVRIGISDGRGGVSHGHH